MADKAPQKSFLMRNLRFVPLIIFVALAAVFLVRLGDNSISTNVPSPLVGKPVPETTLEPLIGLKENGQQLDGVRTDTLKNNGVIIVNVFASWCAPCRVEHPFLKEMAKRDDLKIIGINYKDSAQNALRFLGVLGNPYDAVGVDPKGKASIEWGVYGVPENYIIDNQGVIRYKHIGPIDGHSIEKIKQEIEKAKQPLS